MNAIFMPIDALFQWLLPVLPNLQQLGEWAVSGSVLILIVLGLGTLLKGRLSCRVRYALWGAVLVRLLLPFQLPLSLPVSSAQAVPDAPDAWETTYVPVFPGQTQNIDDAHPYYQDLEPGYEGPGPWSQGYVERSEDGETVTTYLDCFTQAEILQLIWGVGVLAALLLVFVPNARFALRLKKAREPLEIPGCPLPVYLMEGLSSPCLFGLFRPAIYLTPRAADPAALEHVLAHELTHYAHRDHLWAPLRCLALALHWYNPLVWLAVLLSKRDGELACDEGAVRRLGEDQRIPYGRTLVDMVAQRSLRPADLLSCSTAMTGGKKTIQQRIALLVKHPKTVPAALFGAVSLLALAAVFTFSRGAAPSPAQDYQDHLAQARSVRIGMPLISSQDYPFPITDDDLLDQARELLALEELPGNVQAGTRFSPGGDGPSISLSSAAPEEVRYYLEPGFHCYFVLAPEGTAEVGAPVDCTRIGMISDQDFDALCQLSQQQSGRSTPLTDQELAFFNDGSFFDNGTGGEFSIRNQFLTSWYDHPADIDLYQLFYLGTGTPSSISEEERRLVIDRGYGGVDPDCGCTKITRQEMDAVLLEHTGLTLEETDLVGLRNFTYLPEYDAYYHFHGDTNYTFPTFESGERQGSVVYLTYGDYGACQLVLRAAEEGYQFVSNRSSRVGNVPSSSSRLENPEHIAALVELLVQDQAFLTENAQYLGITPEALADALQGRGEEGISPDLLVISTYNGWVPDQWGRGYGHRLTVWGEGSLMFLDLTFPASLDEQVLAFLQQDSVDRVRKDLTQRLAAIVPHDIQSISGGIYDFPMLSAQLAGILNQMADRYLGPDGSSSFTDHQLWTLDILLPEDVTLYLSAGLVEDQVDLSGLLFESPELYQFIRQRWSPPPGSIVRMDLSPVSVAVDQLLTEETAKWNRDFTENGLDAPYTGAELTQFRLLSSYPDLLKEGTVKLYALDYGLTTENLEEAGWAGGNYADGDGLFHPYGMPLHLLTVEQDGQVTARAVLPWEYRLEEGNVDGFISDTYILNVVVSTLEDLLDPVIPASYTSPFAAAAQYSGSLASYYRSLGPSHPHAVTYAAMDTIRAYQALEDGICIAPVLELAPVDVNNEYWQAGAGLEPGPDGHWLYTLAYRLERQEDGTWRCTDSGTSGVVLKELDWIAQEEYEPDQSRRDGWNTDLRAAVTRLNYGNSGTALAVTGQTGALTGLTVDPCGISLTVDAGDPGTWGETLDHLSLLAPDQGAEDGQADPSETARWLRVTKNGQPVSGALYGLREDRETTLRFEFDIQQPYSGLPLEAGDTLVIDLGPEG